MDALGKSILNIWWARRFGGDSNEEGERTSFNIASAFALENGTVQRGSFQTLTEVELTARFSRDDTGNLNHPPLSETDEWHEHLVRQNLLSAKPPSTTATLNVIYVYKKRGSWQGMKADTLKDIISIFGLDTSFLHPIGKATDTWHFIRRGDGTCTFLFVLQRLYLLACSISLTGRQTNCVIFGMPFEKVPESLYVTDFNFYQPAWFDNETGFAADRALWQLLDRIQSHHLHHPLSLAYLCLLDSLSSICIYVVEGVDSINKLEAAIAADVVARESLERLVSLSQRAGVDAIELAKLSRSTGVASLLLETLEDRKGWKRWCQRFVVTADYQTGLHGRASRWLAEGLPSCRQLLENEKIQIRSQEDRVKALTPIVSKLSSDITSRITSELQKHMRL